MEVNYKRPKFGQMHFVQYNWHKTSDELTPDAKIIQNIAKALGNKVKQSFGEFKQTGDKKTWLYSLFDKGRKLSSNY